MSLQRRPGVVLGEARHGGRRADEILELGELAQTRVQVEQLADDATESPIEVITRQELMELIRASLDPVEWKVLRLHYLEGLTGKQVAQKLRLSASRICQIHCRVLDRLKAQFTTAPV